MRLKRETDALVVGAGPVGLFSALSLTESGMTVEVVDKEWRGSMHSYALALHPATLTLLDKYGVVHDLISQGHRIDRLAFYEGERRAGQIDLTALPGNFPFVLVVPQAALERALIDRLEKAGVRIAFNHEAFGVVNEGDHVEVRVGQMEKISTGYPIAHTEWIVARELKQKTGFVIGADGYHSAVRQMLDAKFEHHAAAETFQVFEFPYPMEFHNEGRIVFHEETTNVVWPLGEQRGRWNFQVANGDSGPPDLESLKRLIHERAPWFGEGIEELHWTATAMFERRLADRIGEGRVWLVGDAAHVTGPVGAQSMNVGIREASDLVSRISAIHDRGKGFELLQRYQQERQAEWEQLMGLGHRLEAQPDADDWSRSHEQKILPCLPASGDDLAALLLQVGLTLN